MMTPTTATMILLLRTEVARAASAAARSVCAGAEAVGEGIWAWGCRAAVWLLRSEPQCLHLIAPTRISSLQNGQMVTCVELSIGIGSSATATGVGSRSIARVFWDDMVLVVCWPPFICAPQFRQNFPSDVVGLPQDGHKIKGFVSPEVIHLNHREIQTPCTVNRGYRFGYQPGTRLSEVY